MKVAVVACGLCLALCACADASQQRVATPIASAEGDAHVTIRAEGGRLWWSHRSWTAPHALWRLPTRGPVEGLSVRAVATDTTNDVFVVSFRQGGRSFHGRFGLDATSAIETPGPYLAEDHDTGAMALLTTLERDR